MIVCMCPKCGTEQNEPRSGIGELAYCKECGYLYLYYPNGSTVEYNQPVERIA